MTAQRCANGGPTLKRWPGIGPALFIPAGLDTDWPFAGRKTAAGIRGSRDKNGREHGESRRRCVDPGLRGETPGTSGNGWGPPD